LSSQSKSGAIDQLTLGDRPVDRDRRVGHPCANVLISCSWDSFLQFENPDAKLSLLMQTPSKRSNTNPSCSPGPQNTDGGAIRPRCHFVNNEKIIYLQTICWFGRM